MSGPSHMGSSGSTTHCLDGCLTSAGRALRALGVPFATRDHRLEVPDARGLTIRSTHDRFIQIVSPPGWHWEGSAASACRVLPQTPVRMYLNERSRIVACAELPGSLASPAAIAVLLRHLASLTNTPVQLPEHNATARPVSRATLVSSLRGLNVSVAGGSGADDGPWVEIVASGRTLRAKATSCGEGTRLCCRLGLLPEENPSRSACEHYLLVANSWQRWARYGVFGNDLCWTEASIHMPGLHAEPGVLRMGFLLLGQAAGRATELRALHDGRVAKEYVRLCTSMEE